MFNGIVEATSLVKQKIERHDCQRLVIERPVFFTDCKRGDSLAVNGVCLTMTDLTPQTVSVTIVPETLRLTNLAILQVGALVNLERSLMLGERIHGHFVQGHINEQGIILALISQGNAWMMTVQVSQSFSKYLVRKGFVALDGMSLTIVECHITRFTVTLIPHTYDSTIAKTYCVGQYVNLEADIFGKYCERFLGVSA